MFSARHYINPAIQFTVNRRNALLKLVNEAEEMFVVAGAASNGFTAAAVLNGFTFPVAGAASNGFTAAADLNGFTFPVTGAASNGFTAAADLSGFTFPIAGASSNGFTAAADLSGFTFPIAGASSNGFTATGNIESLYDANASAYFAISNTDSPSYMTPINTAIVAMKAAGLWDKTDRVLMTAGQTEIGSLICWKSLSEDAEVINSPSWNAGQGFTFNGSNQYGNLGFAPEDGVQYQQNSAGIAIDIETSSTGVNFPMGCCGVGGAAPNTSFVFINPTLGVGEVNGSGLGGTGSFNPDGRTAFWQVYRTSTTGTTNRTYKNDTEIGSGGDSSTTRSPFEFFFGARNVGGTANQYMACDIRFIWVGAGLNSTEAAAFADIVETLGTSIGWL